ncbi:MAG: PAS domain S-box protein [Gemmatimonadetes bacterium]|nr:PAS domain S-box protein [Gemmatimonadota bacterium]
MTPVFIFIALALILVGGWALIRTFGRPGATSAPRGGDQAILDQSPVGALLLDPALSVAWANDTFCDLFGLTRSKLMGRGFADVIQQEMRELVEEPDVVEAGLLEAYTSAGKTSPFDFFVRARDGRDRRCIEHSCEVIQKKPLVGGRVAYFVDVTPRENLAVTQHARDVKVEEFDQILVNLARRSGGPETDEATVLRDIAALAAGALKPDRWELWFLAEDRAQWTLGHLNYTKSRDTISTPKISSRQIGPYLRTLDQARVVVTSDVKSDPDAHTLLGQGKVEPEVASRLDVPVRDRGKVVAVFVMVHHTPRPWTASDTRFVAAIGDRMSLIVEAGRARRMLGATKPPETPALPAAASSEVDGFIHLDEKLRFTFLNPMVLQWLGDRSVDGGALVGRGLEESMKGVEDRSIVAEVRKAMRGGGPARLRRQLERDGPWLELFIRPSATGVSVTIQDRARGKEREAERSLLDSETRFRSVVESLREGLIITDLDDRIEYVNPRITDLTGHRPEDLDGKQAQELLFDTKNWKGQEKRMIARREKKRTRYKAPLMDKDGNVLPVEVISTPLRNSEGAVTGVVDAITAVGDRAGQRSEQAGAAGKIS